MRWTLGATGGGERKREKELPEKLLGVCLCWMRRGREHTLPSTSSSSCLTDAGVARCIRTDTDVNTDMNTDTETDTNPSCTRRTPNIPLPLLSLPPSSSPPPPLPPPRHPIGPPRFFCTGTLEISHGFYSCSRICTLCRLCSLFTYRGTLQTSQGFLFL
jgi:hypothetical protein